MVQTKNGKRNGKRSVVGVGRNVEYKMHGKRKRTNEQQHTIRVAFPSLRVASIFFLVGLLNLCGIAVWEVYTHH